MAQHGGIVGEVTSSKARVIAAGPGKQLETGERAPMGVKPKDLVLIGTYSGTEVTVEGDDYVILRESDILAKVNE